MVLSTIFKKKFQFCRLRDQAIQKKFTFSSIETLRTDQINSNIPTNIATANPTTKTKNTPPTFSISNSGVSLASFSPALQSTSFPSSSVFSVSHHFFVRF